MSLYVAATDVDDAQAAAILEEYLGGPDGLTGAIEGLQALCATLLVLLESETGARPSAVLQRVGSMVAANAVVPL